jgi:hypothetical protein
VNETALVGWDLTGVSCTSSIGATEPAGTIELDAGETVTCTFTNTKRGSVTIVKDAAPNDAQDFAFTTTGTGLSAFSLDDDSNVMLPNSKTFSNLVPGNCSVTEGAVAGWDLTGLTCNDANGTTNPGTRTANIALDPGETVTCTFTNTKDFHAGTIGFWKNWRNHYTTSQFQLLINYLKMNNPKIYNKDLIANNTDDLTIAKHDAIMNVGTKTPREQMILAQFTALKFNLAITQLQGTSGLVHKNDNLCTSGVVDVSSISGATALFGTATPTVGQIVNYVESRWTGKLTTNRSDWKWNLTNAQKDTIIKVVSGINEGTLVMTSGCP